MMWKPRICNCVVLWITTIHVQDHPCFLGWGAEDCQEGPENTENQGQDSHKVELEWKRRCFVHCEKYFWWMENLVAFCVKCLACDVRDTLSLEPSGDWNPFHLSLSEYRDICPPSCFVMGNQLVEFTFWFVAIFFIQDLLLTRSMPFLARQLSCFYCFCKVWLLKSTVHSWSYFLAVVFKPDIYFCRQFCSLMLFCWYHSNRPNDFTQSARRYPNTTFLLISVCATLMLSFCKLLLTIV